MLLKKTSPHICSIQEPRESMPVRRPHRWPWHPDDDILQTTTHSASLSGCPEHAPQTAPTAFCHNGLEAVWKIVEALTALTLTLPHTHTHTHTLALLCFAWGLGREQSSRPARVRCPIHHLEWMGSVFTALCASFEGEFPLRVGSKAPDLVNT